MKLFLHIYFQTQKWKLLGEKWMCDFSVFINAAVYTVSMSHLEFKGRKRYSTNVPRWKATC